MYNKQGGWTPSRSAGRSYQDSPYTYQGRQFQAKKKRSGCKFGMYQNQKQRRDGDGEAQPYVAGWRASRGVITSILATPYKGTDSHKSKTGIVWQNWVAKVRVGTQQPYLTSALYNTMTRKVTIKALGYVLNPNAPNGGYCGSYGMKNTKNYR